MSGVTDNLPLKVSVIIPTYNRAVYLLEALESVSKQTVPPWEVIVIDDGSTDDTLQIIENLDKTVRYFRQDHKGVTTARNLGLKKATGNVVAWLDSDDMWNPSFLETVLSVLSEDQSIDGVYSGYTIVSARGESLSVSTRVEPPDALYSALLRDNVFATSTVVFRKKCHDLSGRFDAQFDVVEDYDLWLRMAKRFRIMGIPQALVRVRVHSDSTMSNVGILCKNRLAVTEKHFGKLEDVSNSVACSARSAHGFALRSAALMYMGSGRPRLAWAYMEEAVGLYPDLLDHLDTFYELACGQQPRGYRGRLEGLDIDRNGKDLLEWLDSLFASDDPRKKRMESRAYGNTYLALAMLEDRAGDWRMARRYLRRAVLSNPVLLRQWGVVRRLVKLHAGKDIVNWLRSVQKEKSV